MRILERDATLLCQPRQRSSLLQKLARRRWWRRATLRTDDVDRPEGQATQQHNIKDKKRLWL